MLPALRDDALTTADGGFALRLSLPWIRSLPVSSAQDLRVSIDGRDATAPRVALGPREIPAAELPTAEGWWYLQDRLVVLGDLEVGGTHRVEVSFDLLVPYLPAGPDRPLILPFRVARDLVADAAAEPWAGRDVA